MCACVQKPKWCSYFLCSRVIIHIHYLTVFLPTSSISGEIIISITWIIEGKLKHDIVLLEGWYISKPSDRVQHHYKSMILYCFQEKAKKCSIYRWDLNHIKETFSRKTRKGCWNSFKLLLMEEGCMWTSLLPSYQTWCPLVDRPENCLRLPRATSTMPFSVAATLGYKPAHKIACKSTFR